MPERIQNEGPVVAQQVADEAIIHADDEAIMLERRRPYDKPLNVDNGFRKYSLCNMLLTYRCDILGHIVIDKISVKTTSAVGL